MAVTKIGNLTIGTLPRVVGTIATETTLRNQAFCRPRTCDIAEARLDRIGAATPWIRCCREIETAGIPVLVTLRLASEGGNWQDRDEDREAYFTSALEHLSAVDVEAQSTLRDKICAAAAALNKPVIVSYHNFQQTPPYEYLVDIIREIVAIDAPVIPKIATRINSEADTENLRRLIQDHPDTPLCVLGMGKMGIKSRVIFPCLGSALTYGHLDESTAPGQLSSDYLVQTLRTLLPDYDQAFNN